MTHSPCVLFLAVFALTSLPPHAHADGLIHQLPLDGAWVRYKLSEEGDAAMKDAQKLPHKSAGSLVLRSVGQHELEGERCRWLELELRIDSVATVPDRVTGELKEQKADRHIILKMLIPEKHLTAGADPLADVRKLYFKDGTMEAELIDDEESRQFHLGRLRQLLPVPAQAVDKLHKHRVATPDPNLGALECEMLRFDSSHVGPLARGQGWMSWQGRHEVCLHPQVPFGVASLKYAGESREWHGNNEGDPKVTIQKTTELVVAEMGEGAKSELPEVK